MVSLFPVQPPVTNLELEGAAQKLVSQLPSLLMEARRIAFSVAQGTHGRKRAGVGETFWQFRSYEVGDAASLIDWRRSANSSHLFVREREWEAAHTVWIWADVSASMLFRSHLSQSLKAERAIVLALALGALLSDAGERVGMPGLMLPKSGRKVPALMMESFARAIVNHQSLPDEKTRLSRHGELVLLSDFWEPQDKLGALFSTLAREHVRGHLVQILDPAEESLPYHGRVDFTDLEQGELLRAERAESLRTPYQTRVSAHKAAIAIHARKLGWTPFCHHTDRSAAEVLLALHMHLSGLEKGYRAKGSLSSSGAVGGRALS